MYGPRTHEQAAALRAAGRTWSEISRELGVHRSTLRSWAAGPVRPAECPSCDGAPLPGEAYAALLGFYLGAGCLSRARRCWALRVACDATSRASSPT